MRNRLQYLAGAAFALAVALASVPRVAAQVPATPTIVYGQSLFTTNGAGASTTTLSEPAGGATDSSGNLYVADFSNNRVLYFTAGSTTASRVYGQNGSFTTNTCASVSATALCHPEAAAIDSSGNLWVSDTGNNRVLMYPAGSTTATLVLGQSLLTTNSVGTTQSTFDGPAGIAVDNSGNLYVGDHNNNRVLLWRNASSLSNGAAATLVFGQSSFTAKISGAGAAQFNGPEDIATDSGGNLYVADGTNNRVLYYHSASTQASNGPNATTVLGQTGFGLSAVGSGATGLSVPTGVAPDGSGNLYVADFGNNRVLFFPNVSTASNGEAATHVYGQPDFASTTANQGGSPTAATLDGPYGVFVSGSGRLYVGDFANNRVLEYPLAQTITFPQPATPVAAGGSSTLTATASSGDLVTYTVTSGTATISGSTITYTNTGTVTIAANSAATSTYAAAPTVSVNVVVRAAQTINFTPSATFGISATASVVYGQSGSFNTAATGTGSGGLSYSTAVAADSAGNLYVADTTNNRVLFYPAGTTTATRVYGQSSFTTTACATTATGLCSPQGVAIDTIGNLWVSELGNNRVLMYPPGSTTASLVLGQPSFAANSAGTTSTTLNQPYGLATDSSGNLYAADFGNNRVLMWKSASTLSNGAAAHVVFGQSLFTTNATGTGANQLNAPPGVATDSSGNLYVADYGNNRVVLWKNASSLSNGASANTVFGQTAFGLNASGAGTTGMHSPIGVAADASGNLYVMDSSNNRVLFYPNAAAASNGEVATQVYGQSNFTGVSVNAGGGSPTSASMDYPFSAVVSGAGNLYVADSHNNRVLMFPGSLSNQPFGTAPFAVSAGASSGLAVSFASTTTSVCTVSGATVTLVAAGTCTIQATQAGNATYLAATPVNQSFTVTQGSQTISFTPSTPVTYGVAPIALTATGGASGNAVTFSVSSGPGTLSGSTLTVTGAGTIVIAANQLGNTNYLAATQVSASIVVNPPVPTVISISPASGLTAGGAPVTIAGTNFTGATSVTIGGAAATSITVVSATSITALTPAGAAGTASVVVTTPGGPSAANTPYTYASAPTVTSISPASGPTAGGTPVTIAGTNFTGATSVTIGGAAATSITVVSATSITALTPAGTAGTASVVVTTPGGPSAANTLYTYASAPTVTSISPASGPTAGGTPVTIAGTNFTGATSVTIGGAAATSMTVVNATSITATTPAGTAGTASVVVTTPGGLNAANTLFTYISLPTVTSISPASGPTAGGTPVTITGTNFTGATGVTIGGAAATSMTVVNATSITATTPAGTAGTASVVVTTPGGPSAANTLYTYASAPTVTSINPNSGPGVGGLQVTITGTNFTGATGVTIGGAAATSITVVSATSITATTPAGTAGTASVVVTTPGGPSAANTLYTYASAPTVTSISPNSGQGVGGLQVTITGTNFTGATGVTIGGAAATSITVVSATSITATTPAGTAGTASVVVTTPGGLNAANTLFTYAATPTVISISPASGPGVGGLPVTITGTNFTGATSVTIGGAAATSITVVNATSITATTPAGTLGTTSVVVTTPGGPNAANTLFTYLGPVINNIDQASGPQTGGTVVHITGTNFGFHTNPVVLIDGVMAQSVTITTGNTQVTAITGPASTPGTGAVVLTTSDGSSSPPSQQLFTYVAAPTLTSISPASGPMAGGLPVTITGTNFTGASGVTIGGAPAGSITVVSATSITATTPARTAGTASVVVTTAGGSNAANTLYTYASAPTVTSISPAGGPAPGGTPVTITGTNFTGATSVTIGGAAASGITVVSATSIAATTPAGTAGAASVLVTTPGGLNAANTLFTYVAAVQTITFGAAPSPAVYNTSVTVNATGGASGNPVTFTSNTTGICTVSGTNGATVALIAAGTCIIQAAQSGSTSYAPAAPVTQSFTVTQASQTITFGAAPSPAVYNTSVTVSATGGASGNAVTFTSNTPAVCTVSGSNGATAALIALGTCQIYANQAGNTNYTAAAQVSQSFTVAQASQAIAFTPSTTASVVYGQNGSFTTGSHGSSATGLFNPEGVVSDSSGDLYVADSGNSRVLYYPAGSTTATLVYGQNGSFTTTSCTTTANGLCYPYSVALDRSGNLWVGDYANSRVLMYTPGNTTATRVLGQSSFTSSSTGATSTTLNSATGVATDGSGNLYVADYGNNRVLLWKNASSLANGAAANVVFGQSSFTTSNYGAGSNQLSGPFGVATDSGGNLYVSDRDNSRVVLYLSPGTQSNGVNATTVFGQSGFGFNNTGGGAYGLWGSCGVSVDGGGNLFVADENNNRVVGYPNATSASSGEAATLFYGGGSSPTASSLNSPCGVFANAGNLYVADTTNHRVLVFESLSNQPAGTAPFTVSATASSGLPVSFTSTTAGVCAVSGATVTLLAAGTCTIQASQGGNVGYGAATPVNQSFTVTQGSQTITFGTLSNQPLGTAPFTVNATASSNLTVSFASTTTGVCTVSGATVTLLAVGTCSIQATQAGNTSYGSAPSVYQSFTVTRGSQTITFGTLSNQPLGAAPFTVSATASSNLPVSFASTTTFVCSTSGATVTVLTAGTCTIQATQGGNGNYAAATPVSQSFTVTQASQSIAFGLPSTTATLVYGQNGSFTTQNYLPSANGLEDPVGMAFDSSGNLYVSDNGHSRVLMYPPGSTTATQVYGQNGDFTSNYMSTPPTGLAPWGIAIDPSGNLWAADRQNNRVLMYPPGSTTATLVLGQSNFYTSSAGTTNNTLNSPRGLAVDNSGNLYVADGGNNRVLMWQNASSATNGAAANLVLGQSSFAGNTSGSGANQLNGPAGLATDSSGNLYVAEASNHRVLFYLSPATRSNGASATTVFGQSGFGLSAAGSGATGLNSPQGIATDSNGNLYVADSNNDRILLFPNAATAPSGEAATMVYGEPNFSATQGGESSSIVSYDYGVLVSAAGDLYVADTNNNRVLVFRGSLPNQPLGAAPFNVSAVASSGLSVSFASTTPGVCTVSGLTVTLVAAGTCTIQATQAGNVSYGAASASGSFMVTQGSQAITFGALSNQVFSATPFSVSATASSNLPVSFASTTPSVCTVSGANVTMVAVGTCTIQATQSGNTAYAAATPVSQSFTISQVAQTITFGVAPSPTVYNASVTVGAAGGASGNPVTFTSNTPAVCTTSGINGATVALIAIGTCQILADQAGNTSYTAATEVSQSFTVAQGFQAIAFGAPPSPAVSNTSVAVSATGGASGNPITFASNTLAVCTTSGTNGVTVALIAAGTCEINANQAGNANYAAAAQASQSFTVTQGSQSITLATVPSGLLVSVDGGTAQAAPFAVTLAIGAHTIAVAATQAGTVGIQYVFTGWSDSGAVSHSITVASSPATYTASFQTQYQLTTSASPSAGGTVAPAAGTFYNAGASVSVQATANAGYQLGSFSGGLTGAVNPQTITLNGPVTVIANFTPLAPQLAATVGTRTVSGANLLVALTLTNSGFGPATNATITSITAITDVAGSGTVTVPSGLPVDLGTINIGSNAGTTLTFVWPSTATRVSFKVNFTADGGYSGSNTITTVY